VVPVPPVQPLTLTLGIAMTGKEGPYRMASRREVRARFTRFHWVTSPEGQKLVPVPVQAGTVKDNGTETSGHEY